MGDAALSLAAGRSSAPEREITSDSWEKAFVSDGLTSRVTASFLTCGAVNLPLFARRQRLFIDDIMYER